MTDYERYGEYQASDRSMVGTALTFLFIGLGAGALAALLFAPKSGKQMRRMLRRKYEDAADAISERADDLKKRGSEWVERGSDLVDRGGEIANAAREKVAPFAKAAREKIK
jgi:gas vesicle protein